MEDSDDLINLRLAAADAHHNQNNAKAVEIYMKILSIAPDASDVMTNLAELLLKNGQYNESLVLLDRAVAINPQSALTWYNLAYVHFRIADWDMAEQCARRAIELAPDMARAHFMLGNAIRERGRFAEAAECFKAALRLDETYAEAWSNLGLVFSDLEMAEEACTAFLEAIKHDYKLVAAHGNLAVIFLDIGQINGARQAAERAVALDPTHTNAHNVLGSVYSKWGQHDIALSHFREAIAQDPDVWKIHSNLLFAALHKDGMNLPEVKSLHDEWYAMHGKRIRDARGAVTFKNVPDPNRRLRVGFLSGDFRSHPVGYFIFNTYSRLCVDRPFDVYAYANQFEETDEFTIRFRNLTGADRWRQVWNMPHQKLLELIAEDKIDVLFDLTGHNARHRMDIFCGRAAPVQVTWAGYMATTGIPDMDWLFGDSYQTPMADQPYYCERLYNLPNSFIAFTPPPDAAAPSGQLPYDTKGFLTFGCFNKTDKMTPRAIRLWSAAMREIQGSRLLLKFRGLKDNHLVQLLKDQFESHGISPDRLMMEDSSPHHELLARYNEIDVVLDPLPYTGSTSTLEAIWMSTPLVTLTGEIFPARHSTSYLHSIGVPELVAATEEDYVQKIVTLANDLPRLRHYKQTLRETMKHSPMCNQDLFVPEFVKAVRFVWEDWCNQQK